MAESAHLWAIGFPDVDGADRFRNAVTSLAAPVQHLLLRDLAILVRAADGSYRFDRQPFPDAGNVFEESRLGFLAGIALSAPLLTSTAVGDLLGLAGRPISGVLKIDDHFIREIQALLRPGTSAVLMLDLVGDLQAALEGLRGVGGTILKTNVDIARADLLQSTLRNSHR